MQLAKSPLLEKYDLSSLFIIFCGGSPLSNDIVNAVKRRLNLIGILQGFGMSEMSFSVLEQNPLNSTEGSVGRLQPGTWGKIIDPETKVILGPGEHGEMCFKGSAIMKGYISNRTATNSIIDADDWLHTGDIGYYNNDGEWFIVDRIKELIKYKGYQVPPAELEAVLLSHPKILDAGVIGVPNDASGELARAFVVKRPDVRLTDREIIDYVAGNCSSCLKKKITENNK